MFDADTVNQPTADDEPADQWTREEVERHMREFLATLSPPMPIEELARVQGIRIPQRLEDLTGGFTEEDFEGFDEFLEELRHGMGDLQLWTRGVASMDGGTAMSTTQPAEQDDASFESGSRAGFWHLLTFEEIVHTQGIRPVEKLEDIMGGWPEDERDDGFEEAVQAMRREDLRREQSQ